MFLMFVEPYPRHMLDQTQFVNSKFYFLTGADEYLWIITQQ